MLRYAAALLAVAVVFVPMRARATSAAATLTVTPAALSFTSSGNSNQYLTASTTLSITGTLITKFGTASIALMSSGDITGGGGGLLSISRLSMTCAGPAQAGESFVATKTPLVASSSVNCATYANGYNSATFGGVNLTLSLFLDERSLSADSYPATNFIIVATAT